MSSTRKFISTTMLPPASLDGSHSLESCIYARRSVRSYSGAPLSLRAVSQLLWAAQGITAKTGERAAPSAGATYPLETYLVVERVKGLEKGIYWYQVEEHSLSCIDVTRGVKDLALTTFGQDCVRESAATVVFTAVYERTRKEYGPVSDMFVHMEAGHAAQNLCLQAVALGLGTVCVGAFKEPESRKLLQLPQDEVVVYMVAAGPTEG